MEDITADTDEVLTVSEMAARMDRMRDIMSDSHENCWSFERNGIMWWIKRPHGWEPSPDDSRKNHRRYRPGDQSWLPNTKERKSDAVARIQ